MVPASLAAAQALLGGDFKAGLWRVAELAAQHVALSKAAPRCPSCKLSCPVANHSCPAPVVRAPRSLSHQTQMGCQGVL